MPGIEDRIPQTTNIQKQLPLSGGSQFPTSSATTIQPRWVSGLWTRLRLQTSLTKRIQKKSVNGKHFLYSSRFRNVSPLDGSTVGGNHWMLDGLLILFFPAKTFKIVPDTNADMPTLKGQAYHPSISQDM